MIKALRLNSSIIFRLSSSCKNVNSNCLDFQKQQPYFYSTTSTNYSKKIKMESNDESNGQIESDSGSVGDKSLGKQNTFYFEQAPSIKNRPDLYDRIPVVLLLGWTGAKDQHLIKYKNIYSSLDFHTIRFAPSNKLTFIQTSKHKSRTYELLDLMKNEYKLTKNPIFIHMFSNASGFIVYQHLINEMNGTGGVQPNKDYEFFKRNHCGIIFDSSPGWPKFLHAIEGVADLIGNQVRFQLTRYLLATLMVSTFAVYQAYHLNDSYFSKMFETLKRDPRLIPTLGIYSRADRLIAASNIEKFFKERKQLFPDMPLKTVEFKDAPHVLIYQKYPDEYLKLVHEHLELCKLVSLTQSQTSRPTSKL